MRGPKPPRSSNFWLEETGLHQRFAAVLCIVALAVVGRKSLLGGELLQVLAGFAVVVDVFARLHQLVADEGGLEYAVFSHRSLLLRLRRSRSGSWSACPARTARCRRCKSLPSADRCRRCNTGADNGVPDTDRCGRSSSGSLRLRSAKRSGWHPSGRWSAHWW